MIAPHGGRLVERLDFSDRAKEEAMELPRLSITLDEARDLGNIGHGVFSPLEGYMSREDFENVLEEGRLSNDLPWTIPIVKDVDEKDVDMLFKEDEVALFYEDMPIAILKVEEIYPYDKKEYAEKVYRTTSIEHPGVASLMAKKQHLVGGKITLVNDPPTKFPRYKLWPKETRILFKERGWKTVVGFQT
ncbi:sulfate adenylyltransferase, partial [Euryarchaeota archaeon ex4484_178]